MSEDAKKLSPKEKLWAVKEYLSGKGSTYSIADKYGVTDTSIRRWVDRYKIDGEQAFHKKPLASSLSQKEKLRAVHEYLQGALSLRDIARKYGVGDTSVRKWIAKYNSGGDAALLPNHTKKHYSKPFKQEVIQAYLAGEGNYAELCVRYTLYYFFQMINVTLRIKRICSHFKGYTFFSGNCFGKYSRGSCSVSIG